MTYFYLFYFIKSKQINQIKINENPFNEIIYCKAFDSIPKNNIYTLFTSEELLIENIASHILKSNETNIPPIKNPATDILSVAGFFNFSFRSN